VAYADSTSDLPMLEAVGFPVAVNPETKLAALARRRGWLIEHWSTSAGAPAKRLPLAPRGRRGSARVLCADMPPTAAQMLTERVGGSA